MKKLPAAEVHRHGRKNFVANQAHNKRTIKKPDTSTRSLTSTFPNRNTLYGTSNCYYKVV